MNIKTIEKATKLLARIKELDEAILAIDKQAIYIASNPGAKIDFSLSVEEVSKEGKVDVFDEHGFIKREFCSPIGEEPKKDTHSGSSMFTFWIDKSPLPDCSIKTQKTKDYKTQIVDTESLEILGILLIRKQQERNILIKKLESL